jgi:hypothetical protein
MACSKNHLTYCEVAEKKGRLTPANLIAQLRDRLLRQAEKIQLS